MSATPRPRKPAPTIVERRTAVIDIGSNSVRLVVYQGPERLPATIFNEKVMAGLGKALAETGAIAADAMALARTALARFAWLAREMAVDELRTVATAAVRDASNGGELLSAARALGLDVEILSGEDEATAAGLGVLSAIPEADGIVGDLGGGSLELVRVVAGTVTDRASFPLGVLRLGAMRAKGRAAFEAKVAKLLADSGWTGRGKGLPLYMVGGSWRALARLDMQLTGYPLPVIHEYAVSADEVARLGRSLARLEKARIKSLVSSARVPTLADAAALLTVLLKQLGASTAIASANGLREGLLFQRLAPEVRAQDPLIVAARGEGVRLGRFPEHGDLVDHWIAPLFDGESAELARLRHAACLLADVGWRANPEFRAERGVEIALHGDWVAIDARGRALIAQALHSSLGGGTDSPDPLGRLAPHDELAEAAQWGLAMRLGQRLSGGVSGPLERTTLAVRGGALVLGVAAADAALYGETVERRHKALAGALGLEATLEPA
ncbi:Ppx/GppA family phosphatase [Sphingomonas donggukensis]|uniref:Ppx/GppA family phosphatase n=1 Tax=Sphingomonas donggukensis TaxID=2949093 RepID=A0ABY4TZ48_9SPHN|nr:Ppx/GppA family phosphatase [Sphingomonas donggukensis]URW76827.1 Ppx/GppA family phosphatase [Sphingomonas donggukensis]